MKKVHSNQAKHSKWIKSRATRNSEIGNIWNYFKQKKHLLVGNELNELSRKH